MSGLRAAARCILRVRPTAAPQLTTCRAFMSTRAPDALFQTPSFPMPEDASMWKSKYPRADPAHLWMVGSFPVQGEVEEEEGALACSEDLWDTPGMLSALHDNLPLRDADNMDALLLEMDGYLADSVVKKRRKKMNKHKHRKRKKALRMRTKKN
ncbi:hypothetical protein P3T76_012002 [Phytophthora citrophthora]|uniref:Ribosomal protein mS38 C-terminal domain-containing protein n=1 Tax=Phytophthora citrophthora TaxID=4793 RepID=A0AAD9G5Z3_9STRA|nr:hypothetical protein P3T76_012002 [Phytophthora citrophthora]